ncbi:penicillin-binding protein 1A [Alkalicaulis satelles]|uniref:Penicillin-binding protein 1A n=1 Tax=Alkalicaulis satelles TaxID=2609175 RepID=A0A5M6ZIR4_9PROT|nr:penicillin-binding protein 1A [Alkalicaulis satelles]KAA5804669.1 penicillin-binding protein 1A [Alkalicaulis satelles]
MKLLSWKNALRTVVWGGALAAVLAVAGAIAAAVYVVRVTGDLPDYQQLAQYEPAIMSRVHAGDGLLIAEYAREHRVFVPIENIPPDVINAFLAAEDRNFYQHGGLDFTGIARAAISNISNYMRGRRLEGASTITQQVAKNFLLSSEQAVARKVQEMVLARRMERAFTKDRILELYLNEIYLGNRAYGVAAAALNYFDKSLDELELHEIAYLAALPKGPNNYHPVRRPEAAVGRRNWVLSRMAANDFITEARAAEAGVLPLEATTRLAGETYLAAEYFVEQVRREVFNRYGDQELYEGGLSIRTTLDTRLQLAARRALRDGLHAYDRRHGYRGPLERFEDFDDWPARLAAIRPPADIDSGWQIALVLEVSDSEAVIGFSDRTRGRIPLYALRWARSPSRDRESNMPRLGPAISRAGAVLELGDVVLVEQLTAEDAPNESVAEDHFGLRQIPEVNGAIVAMDPFTGRVLAMVGGYSFAQSQFNRAVQARRQPGSSFKPFVYAAALDNGYTPVSIILDAPFVASGDAEIRFYRPTNYSNVYYGPSTLRRGLELSRNVMTVRLAQDMGMRPVSEYGRRFGLYDNLQPTLAMSLGAGETTLMNLTGAYGALVNGGRRVPPTLIDRVQDRQGRTIWLSDQRECEGCNAPQWAPDMAEPDLAAMGEEAVDPVTAYQVVHMLEGAVARGTGSALRALGRPLAGKTGTTNEFRDAWFVGFSPDLVVGVYVGFDTPAPLGQGEAGGVLAAPIARDFLRPALEGYPVAAFRVPNEVSLAPVDRETGAPSVLGRPGAILEAFRPGTEPRRGATAAEETLSFGFGAISRPPGGLRTSSEDDEDEDDELGGLY